MVTPYLGAFTEDAADSAAPGEDNAALGEDYADIDGDERVAAAARWRNDATRVTAGTMNRYRDVNRHVREELDEEGERVWWGRHEW